MKSFGHRLYIFSMWWRIGYGFLRVIFGVAILHVVGIPLIEVVKTVMQHELVQDHSDRLYQVVNNALMLHPLYVTYFLSIYFIFWGVLDIVLSYNLLRGRRWAFPASLVCITGFIAYEMVRFTHTHSYILLGVVVIDLLILALIYNESKKAASHTHTILQNSKESYAGL